MISAYSIPLLIQTFGEDGQDVFSVVVEILIDLTSIVMMIELLVAIYKSRRLKKELEQEAL